MCVFAFFLGCTNDFLQLDLLVRVPQRRRPPPPHRNCDNTTVTFNVTCGSVYQPTAPPRKPITRDEYGHHQYEEHPPPPHWDKRGSRRVCVSSSRYDFLSFFSNLLITIIYRYYGVLPPPVLEQCQMSITTTSPATSAAPV